jgi:hypothetical protein
MEEMVAYACERDGGGGWYMGRKDKVGHGEREEG